jgi:hypothetical protein
VDKLWAVNVSSWAVDRSIIDPPRGIHASFRSDTTLKLRAISIRLIYLKHAHPRRLQTHRSFTERCSGRKTGSIIKSTLPVRRVLF